ncbi:MAG: diphthine synthase [Nanoarchaeota archaeon]|nr:diphthine synthase [Nanoarchaeota archaeon]
MTLYLIGLGLNDEKDITVKGLEAIKKCKYLYLEYYTSILQIKPEKLEKFYKKKITLAGRELIEKRADEILNKSKKFDTALLIIGDPMSATTHIDLFLRAKEKNIKTEVIHNASILTAVGITGLQLYKFGKTTSIPFAENYWALETPYNVLKQNQKQKLHTLFLLDLNPLENKFMSINDAIDILLKIESKKKNKIFSKKTKVIGCARLGSKKPLIVYDEAQKLMKKDFGKPPYCLIVPGQLHFMEEEALKK